MKRLSAADQLWRRKVEENSTEREDDPRDIAERPVVPLLPSERPTKEMAAVYFTGSEQKIIKFVAQNDPESGACPILPATLIGKCFLHAHFNLKNDDLRSLLLETKTYLKSRESELVSLVEKFRSDQMSEKETQSEEPNTAGAIGLMMARIPLMFQVCYWASNAAEIAIFWKRALDQQDSDVTSLYSMSQRYVSKLK